jgi:hypothetical protein
MKKQWYINRAKRDVGVTERVGLCDDVHEDVNYVVCLIKVVCVVQQVFTVIDEGMSDVNM